ncbi:MAG TPA: hypothetical protein DCM71_02995, partial [Runella sp.]|nr:hypothetical protein [Runella sp.]
RQLFDEFAHNISVVIGEFVTAYQPEVFVFGGNIAQSSHLFFPEIDAYLTQQSTQVVLRQSALNEFAALMGSVRMDTSHITML